MNNKKRLIFIGGGVIAALLVALITVLLLRQYDSGSRGLQAGPSQQVEETQNGLTGSPSELRSKGISYVNENNKDEALKYFKAARTGFEKIGDKAAVEEIDMHIDQANLLPNPSKEKTPDFIVPSEDPNYVTQ